MSGATRSVSLARSPMRRIPISRTRNRVSTRERSMVSGTPSSLLSEPVVAIVGAALDSTAVSRSLVLVLPRDPVTPTTVSPSRSRATTWAASACNAALASSTTTVGSAVGREPSTATAPAWPAWAAWSWPSACSPAKATKRPPGSACRPSSTAGGGHRHGAVTLDPPADHCGDLAEAERDHASTAQGPEQGTTEVDSLEFMPPRQEDVMLPARMRIPIRRRYVACQHPAAYGYGSSACSGRQRIVGVFKNAYASATPRSLDWTA